jgi:hypothetical protein
MLRNHSSPLFSRRGTGYRHAMTAEDVLHLLTVGRAAGGGSDHFSSFAEICRAHYRWGYEGKLFHILAAEVIEGALRLGYAQRLPGSVRDDG